MKIRHLVLAAVIVISISLLLGLIMFFKPHSNISKMKAEYKVEANDLINEFQTDEVTANKKYNEKAIEISGLLISKNKLPNGNDLIIIADEMFGISCQLDSTWAKMNYEAINTLTPGSKITIRGICKGYLMEVKINPSIVILD